MLNAIKLIEENSFIVCLMYRITLVLVFVHCQCPIKHMGTLFKLKFSLIQNLLLSPKGSYFYYYKLELHNITVYL